jgi:excisionase family DNA binding protein
MTVVSALGPERLDDLQLYEVCDVMRMLRLSRTVIYELIRSGRLRSVKQGRARRVPASAVRDYIALLEREAEQ